MFAIRSMQRKTSAILFIIICFFGQIFFSPGGTLHAEETAKNRYLLAEKAYNKLLANPAKQKYRSFWLDCIELYQSAYEKEPKSIWAAAGLYKSGVLYYELYKHSFNMEHKNEALQILERVRAFYPGTPYALKADETINNISGQKPSPPKTTPLTAPLPETDKTKTPTETLKPVTNTSVSPELPKDISEKITLSGIKCIVIDPGHGGKDNGAIGYYKGIYEKDIVLNIAKKLAEKIKDGIQCRVIMTRTDDRFLKLDERTEIANRENADLFISIHTNALGNKKVYGIETYILNNTTDKDSLRVAARENDITPEEVSDLQLILTDLMQNAKINESSLLAGHVHNAVYSHLKGKYSKVKNIGLKQAPFYVLLGARMPCILIETGFLTNPKECKSLCDPKYQDDLTVAIFNGIIKYSREPGATAFLSAEPETGAL